VLDGLRRVLSLEGAAVLHRHEGGWQVEAASGDRVPDSPGASTETVELDHEHVLALNGGPIRSDDQRVLDAFARELAAAVHLGELEAEAKAAGAISAANELRAAILSAVSHDLRTPISAIKASVTSLLQRDVDWTPDARQEFLETIDEETDRLNALVGNLLDMSRLQAGALDIHAVPVGLDDRGLLERALANVISNAVRFSPPGSPPRVTAGLVDSIVDVRVVDCGPGIPEAERDRLFKPFSGSATPGRARASGSASPWRRASSRRWAARSRPTTRRAAG
jgi:two-component system, OmpR family, sensor histidine kinase KdpD